MAAHSVGVADDLYKALADPTVPSVPSTPEESIP